MQQRYHYSIRFGSPLSGSIRMIIIINVVIFLLQIISSLSGQPMSFVFGLVPSAVITDLAVWQLVTYMFLHGGIFHLLINMLMLWMFGSEIESTIGTNRFLFYYFLCGVGAGILTTIATPTSFIPIIGASGAIYGILLAYGVLFPNRIVLFMFVFPMKVKYMVLIFAAIEFIASADQAKDGISHITHLGGMIFGAIYLFLQYKGVTFRKIVSHIRQKRTRNKFKVIYYSRDTYRHDDDDETIH